MKWEQVSSANNGITVSRQPGVLLPREVTFRMRVPDGWTVLYLEMKGENEWAKHDTLFVPDGKGSWNLEPGKDRWVLVREDVDGTRIRRILRFWVPEGWIILDKRFSTDGTDRPYFIMTYEPDEGHEWQLDTDIL